MRKTAGKQKNFNLKSKESDEKKVENYLEFSVIQWDSDWTKPDEADWHTYTKMPMRECTIADFCFTKTDEECTDTKRISFWNDWKAFSTACPNKDHPDYKPLMLKGDPGSMVSRKVILNVQQCNPANKKEGEEPCATPEEIDAYAEDLSIEEWSIQRKIYFGKYGEETTYSTMDMKSQVLLEPKKIQMDLTFLRVNDIETQESWLQLGQFDAYRFFDIQKVLKKTQFRSVNDETPELKDSYYMTILFMDQVTIQHGRRIYSLFDLLGDLGGVTEVIMICFGFMLYPISEHSFYLKAFKKLFIAKTEDETIFIQKKIKSKVQKKDIKNAKTKEMQHRQINISLGSSIKLYLKNYLSSWFGIQCCTPKGKLQRLYEEG